LQNSVKFRGNIKIPQKEQIPWPNSTFHDSQKNVGSSPQYYTVFIYPSSLRQECSMHRVKTGYRSLKSKTAIEDHF